MSQLSLASSGGEPRWEYIRPGVGRTGRSLSENNFAKERRDWLSILLREILQNALDARSSTTEPVSVSVRHTPLSDVGAQFMASLITKEHLTRFKESVPHLRQDSTESVDHCLIVEDFGTCGLTGAIDEVDRDGPGQNWNAFWFREGEGGKENTSGNGGAGQGKITYFSTSAVRTIFAYTVRAGQMDEALFGASSFLRDYLYDGLKWKRDAYWGIWRGMGEERQVLPVQHRERIESFCRLIGLQRQADQTGLSLVIPAPKDISLTDALQITIAEFFVPILRGDLVVTLGETTVDSGSVAALADQYLPDDRARALHTCTTKGYRDFLALAISRSAKNEVVVAKPLDHLSQLCEASFDPSQLQELKAAIREERPIAVRLPVKVKSKSTAPAICHFDVHLCCPFELDQPEQAVIRRDLLIGEEPIGSGKLRQRARGLTLIGDETLSKLLLSAEEATHLRWNARLPRLSEYYRSGPEVIAIVRNAMVKILEILTDGELKRDFKLLSRYFTAPGTQSSVPSKGKRSRVGKQPTVPGDIPPARPKLLAIDAFEDGCRVRPAKVDALSGARLPIDVRLEFAYEGLDKDAFSEYDPLDFDLTDNTFVVQSTGCTIYRTFLNQMSLRIEAIDFGITIRGFDRNLRLRIRLNYEEAIDAATVDAE